MEVLKICKNCGKEFEARSKVTLFCCIDCRDEFYQKEKEAKLVEEGVDHVVCKWCGAKTPRIYGQHIKNFHPGKTSEDYKNEFPGELLCCSNDRKATSINSGKFMREEKYRKLFSEMWKGDKNPNSKANRSDQERKEASPFSKEFYIKKGYSEEEAENKLHEFAKNALKDRVTNTSLEYYLNEGMSETDARKALSKRQKTNTIESYIKKYGEELGRKKFYERQIEWSKKVEAKYRNHEFSRLPSIESSIYSNIEKTFVSKLNDLINENTYSCFSKQFNLRSENYNFYYDFCYKNKIIEFNGVYWHCKPTKYEKDFYVSQGDYTAEEVWKKDAAKIKAAEDAGYKVLVVWEDDYEKDPDAMIKKCIQFLND